MVKKKQTVNDSESCEADCDVIFSGGWCVGKQAVTHN